jgi:2-polyprenyl-6-methoxyphenol hydroxylase-like FAD-dependent oxidoreductase
MIQRDVLISGGGIAGLTLAILLKEAGHDPVVVERESSLRADGYMMDFFGTGWDVAVRMGLVEALRAIRYPIDTLQYVDNDGCPYLTVPIQRIRRALSDKYVYLRRSDLERILFDRARALAIDIRFGCSVSALKDRGPDVHVQFDDGSEGTFSLVFGADGVHSRVRELVFGAEQQFARFLGYYVAALHFRDKDYGIGRSVKLHEETDRLAMFYPLDQMRLDATCVIRHANVGMLPSQERLAFVRRQYEGSGWIAARVLNDHSAAEPLYFDTATQIVMPRWHAGRVALLGDACGCLTLIAGQGSHMAMAGAYILARELARRPSDHVAAFERYERFLGPIVAKKQRSAAGLARRFVPSGRSMPALRRLVLHILFSEPVLKLALPLLGSRSIFAESAVD